MKCELINKSDQPDLRERLSSLQSTCDSGKVQVPRVIFRAAQGLDPVSTAVTSWEPTAQR